MIYVLLCLVLLWVCCNIKLFMLHLLLLVPAHLLSCCPDSWTWPVLTSAVSSRIPVMVSVSTLPWPERATSLSTEMGTEMVGRGRGLDTGEQLLELPSEVAAISYCQMDFL